MVPCASDDAARVNMKGGQSMPWRKYTPKAGKYGPIYHIDTGVQVRRDARGKWTLFIEKEGRRANHTIGEGRVALRKAITAAEHIAKRFDSKKCVNVCEPKKTHCPGFIEFSKQWFNGNERRWDSFTSQRYEEVLRLHIWPFEAFKQPINVLGRKDIKQHLRHIFKKRSSATVETVHTVISGIFEEAVDDEIMDANPARGLLKKILPPKKQRDVKDSAPFIRKELVRFLDYAQSTCSVTEALLLKLMAHGGLRLGEALAMRIKHLDLNKMSYHVTQSYKLHRFKKPKFGKTRRVDLPVFLVEELKDYRVHLKKESLKAGRGGNVDLLFPDPDEKGLWPYSQRKVQALVKRVCKGAGLEIRNPHDLRHTYATLLLMAHQSPGYVQQQLGHSSISITMDIYCHWIPGEGRCGLEDALLGPENGVPKVYENRI